MEENMQMIPFIAVEADKARQERREKRDFIIKIILIAVCVISNAAHIWYESQFEKVTETTETVTTTYDAKQDGSGVNIVGGGNIDYGTTSENNTNEN